jgi:hypothetical protein
VADTKLDIWNAAIDRVGEDDALETEGDDRPSAAVCLRHYDRLRRLVLKTFPWPFATHQAAIAQPVNPDTGQIVTRVGWGYVYGLPDDCLTPIALLGEGMRIGLLGAGQRMPFKVLSNDKGDGRLLCCDVSPNDFEVLEYTRDIDDEAAFGPDFADALAWRLGVELALARRKDARLAQTMMQGFSGAVAEAWAAEMRGQQEDPEPDASSIQARTGFVLPFSRG